jgi:hypothetical protein
VGLFFTVNALPQIAAAAGILDGDPAEADRGWDEAERMLTSLGPLVDDDAASFVIGGANFRRAVRRIDDGAERLDLSRWMEEQRAEMSFPAGLVAVDEHARTLQPVLVAVIPDAFVFVDEDGDDDHTEMVELGRFRRDAVRAVEVLDDSGAPVADPGGESIDEPERRCRLVVTWSDERPAPQTDEFLFRSAFAAWRAAHRFRRSAIPPLDGPGPGAGP